MGAPERLSIEVTRRCAKGCSFCYNGSHSQDTEQWDADELLEFALDCSRQGTRSISFGGGEPLQWSPLFSVLEGLSGAVFRSVTTNGLLLDRLLPELVGADPDKVHVSIHFPSDKQEVSRVIRQVRELQSAGIRSGVNLLVRASELTSARVCAARLRTEGIDNGRIMYLPMRGSGTDLANFHHTLLQAFGINEKFGDLGTSTVAGMLR